MKVTTKNNPEETFRRLNKWQAGEIERLLTEGRLLVQVLKMAREKLEVYRDHSDGQYHGGVEHTALIGSIDTALATGLGKHE